MIETVLSHAAFVTVAIRTGVVSGRCCVDLLLASRLQPARAIPAATNAVHFINFIFSIPVARSLKKQRDGSFRPPRVQPALKREQIRSNPMADGAKKGMRHF